MRAQRLQVSAENLFILSETRMSDILATAEELKPDILIVDSIQTMFCDENESSPGSVSQVKDCTMTLMQISKNLGITVFVVGHINKDGNIAGPKVLEHMVDCVLYFEGDPNTSYRLLRCAKNRFGSTNEIGVFEMRDIGLVEVPNPSQMLLEGRPEGASGTCVACVMEGTRPILAEVQALVTKTSFNVPRRACDGFDFNRAVLLMAVAEKRAGLQLSQFDAYLNVIGGLRLDEPGADLPVVLAIASSYRDTPLSGHLAAIGEVGLTGEIRSVSHMEQRLQEVARLGFRKCIIPKNGSDKLEIPYNLVVYRVRNLKEAIEVAV
jgi:DNA repair protein RadA/Sms